jgi:CRP/FNR family transcriptional regulator
MENILNIISAIPLFNGLPDDQLSAIRQIAVEKQYSKGQTIFSEEDETKGLFVVVDGRVKIYKVSSEGKEQILHIIEAGQSFGEVTVFTGQQMPANAQTLACGSGDGQSVPGPESVGDYVKKAAPVCGSN